jgi:hypothetical protein
MQFFPTVPETTHFFPEPLSDEFWSLYAEPVDTFLRYALIFEAFTKRDPNATEIMLNPIGLAAEVAPDGRRVERWRCPSLLSALAKMVLHDGAYTLARDDAGRVFDDTIATTGHWTKYGAIYHIPYRSLLPKRTSNLLVAGRCISVDHRVHHATKEIPACFATGQAASTAAALAVRADVEPAALDVAALRARLRDAGAILELPA